MMTGNSSPTISSLSKSLNPMMTWLSHLHQDQRSCASAVLVLTSSFQAFSCKTDLTSYKRDRRGAISVVYCFSPAAPSVFKIELISTGQARPCG